MLKKIRCTFEMEIDVVFEDPEKAEAYFVRGDWKNHFYEAADLDAVAEALSHGFHHETDQWDNEAKCWFKFVEGFGKLVKVKDTQSDYKTTEEFATDGGHILVRYESELDHAGTFEV